MNEDARGPKSPFDGMNRREFRAALRRKRKELSRKRVKENELLQQAGKDLGRRKRKKKAVEKRRRKQGRKKK